MSAIEKRGAPRKRVMIPAVVSDRNWSNIDYCLICDASKSGCRLKSNNLNYIPDEIFIKVERLKRPIKGKVVWRKNGMAGVQFFWDTPYLGDQRGDYRLETDFTAVISDREESLVLQCVVKNASGAGCMIAADRIDDLPEEVCVKFEESDAPLAGRIVWRNGNMAGVAFVWEDASGEERTADIPFYI